MVTFVYFDELIFKRSAVDFYIFYIIYEFMYSIPSLLYELDILCVSK